MWRIVVGREPFGSRVGTSFCRRVRTRVRPPVISMQPRFCKDPCAEQLRELVAAEVASRGLLDCVLPASACQGCGRSAVGLVSYWMLVIVTPPWWPVCFLSFVLAALAVALNLMHDGNHQAFSRNARTNRLAGFTLDLLGVSSLFWVEDHNRKHHGAPNVDPFDGDIDYGSLPVLRRASHGAHGIASSTTTFGFCMLSS